MPQPQTLALLSTHPNHGLELGQCKAVALSTLIPLARAWTTILELAHNLSPEQPNAFSEALVQALPYLPPHTVGVCLAGDGSSEDNAAVLLYRPSYEQVFLAASVSQLEVLCSAYPEEAWQLFTLENKALCWHSLQVSGSSSVKQGLHVLIPAASYLLNHWVQGGETLAFLKQAGAEIGIAEL